MNGKLKSRKLSQALSLKKFEKSSISLQNLISTSTRDKSTRTRLGPGSYNISLNTFFGPSFQFSQSQRFIYSDPYSKYFNTSKKSTSINPSIPEINLETFRPTHKLSKIKEDAEVLSQKLSLTRSNKKRLEQEKKYKFLKTLKDKSLKFHLRQKVKQFKPLSKVFHVLMISWTASCIWKAKAYHLKLKKMKIFMNVGFLRGIVRALGKFRTLLRKIRMFRSYRVIKKFAQRMKDWVKRRKETYREKIDLICNQYADKFLFKSTVVKLDVVIRGIQQAWKRLYLVRKTTLKAKVRIFRMFEKVIVTQFKSKYIPPVRKALIVKEIESHRFKKFKEYNREHNKYKNKCKEIDKKREKQVSKYGSTPSIQPIHTNRYPKKPVPSYFIKKSKYIEMIIYLINRRSQCTVRVD